MNIDDFEKQLQQQTPRQIPAGWRAEILNTARAATPSPQASSLTHHGSLSTLSSQLSTLLWPHPKAWAALAAVWVAIVAMNLSVRDEKSVAKAPTPPTREMILVLREQRRELARLMEPNALPAVDKPKSFPSGPRSERREGILAA